MKKTTANSQEEIKDSVTSIYSALIEKRKADAEAKAERKQAEKEAKKQEKESKYLKEDGTKMTKKERKEAELEAWKEIVIGLTGEDLDYSSRKKKKKKYKKWIGEDENFAINLDKKPKKVKKKNYQKEFEPELNMLKNIVADQNRFTADLQKRFQNAAGPANKDAMPLNKTLVDLAANINTSRNNSLGMLKAIGDLKRTIADLYMKQKKMDNESGGSSFDNTDLGLLGSSVASSIFGDNAVNPYMAPVQQQVVVQQAITQDNTPQTTITPSQPQVVENNLPYVDSTPFDPSTWEGEGVGDVSAVKFETIPHSIVVEWHKNDNKARFKAIDDNTGEELVGCPVPTSDPTKLTFDENNMRVKGEFDETYKLEIV